LAIDNFSLTAVQDAVPPVSPVPDGLPLGVVAALLAGVLSVRGRPLKTEAQGHSGD
jgi:hypothetical protein